MKQAKLFFLVMLVCAAGALRSQFSTHYNREGLKIYLSSDSSRWVRGTGLAQIWLRYNANNPGSAIFNTPVNNTFDVGLRRVRYQTLAQLTSKVFFYMQFGLNSVGSLAARKSQLFFHDVTAEYAVYKNHFTVGLGLSGWNGTARYTSSAVGSILGMDLPLVQETTNDITDQFVRRMGLYAKGKLGSFDYRFSVANPFPVQTASTAAANGGNIAALPPVSSATSVINSQSAFNQAYFSTRAPELNYQGYIMWQFLDQESNQSPYMNGSYLGKKRVFNIGAGFQYQANAMVYRSGAADTAQRFTALRQIGVDVFYDTYLNKEKQTAATLYAAFLNYDFGPNYIRTAGIMNTANSSVGSNIGTYSGVGNSFPLYGTGNVIYAQAAYLFKKDLLKKQGTLQPYMQFTHASYERLNDPVLMYNIGINWIMAGQNSKISLDYQSRPVYKQLATGDITEVRSARRGQIVVQYQVMF